MILNRLGTVASTNDVARRALLGAGVHGEVFRADSQTAGRGRQGRSWLSQTGNLMMSVVLRPKLAPEAASLTTLAAAVAAQRVLSNAGVEAGLKWPNDLLVDGRKLAGILVEGVFEGSRWQGCVVGLGVNVALDIEAIDDPVVRGLATSFAALEVSLPDLDQLALDIRDALVDEVKRLERGETAALLNDWRAVNVTLGRSIRFEQEGRLVDGVAVGLDPSGGLVAEVDGRRTTIHSGEVHLLRDLR